jgi:hypothetical protein
MPDKTAATQHSIWSNCTTGALDLYNCSPLARHTGSITLHNFWMKVIAFLSDHANNQLNRYKLFKEWRIHLIKELQGYKALKKMSDEGILQAYAKEKGLKDTLHWNKLPEERKMPGLTKCCEP